MGRRFSEGSHGQQVPVGGPGSATGKLLVNFQRLPAIDADHVYSSGRSAEGNFRSIRRNEGITHLQWGVGQLLAFSSIAPAAPQGAIWIGSVGNPLSITREGWVRRRDSGEERHELMRLHVIPNQLATGLGADGKDLFPIATRERVTIRQRAVCETNWRSRPT